MKMGKRMKAQRAFRKMRKKIKEYDTFCSVQII